MTETHYGTTDAAAENEPATPAASPAEAPGAAPQQKEGRFLVRLSHPQERARVAFSSVSEERAKSFIERRYPRGSGAYLETPDGSTYHYEAERVGERGSHADPWAEFNPEDFQAPEPGVGATAADDYADREG